LYQKCKKQQKSRDEADSKYFPISKATEQSKLHQKRETFTHRSNVNLLAYTTETNFIQYTVERPIYHKPWKSTDSKQMQEPSFDLINEKINNSWMEQQEPLPRFKHSKENRQSSNTSSTAEQNGGNNNQQK
jgi:hypothetical protein